MTAARSFKTAVLDFLHDPGRDVATRAAKTFFQTFVGVVTADAAGILHTGTLKTAAVAGLGSLASVIQNSFK